MIGALAGLNQEQQCELLYFDESGFSPNPPVQYGWSRIGQARSVEPLAHRQRVNVLGALRHDGQLTWTTQQRSTTRDDVIIFFDQIAAQPHSVPRVVLIDNAGIHKGKPMERSDASGQDTSCTCTICRPTIRTQSYRDSVEARQAFLAPLRRQKWSRPAGRGSVLDGRFRKHVHNKFWMPT